MFKIKSQYSFKWMLIGYWIGLVVLICYIYNLNLLIMPKVILISICTVYFILCSLALILCLYIVKRKINYITANGENILIVAPHQDDGVAMAGGYAIQTLEKGGQVTVLYITSVISNENKIRIKEAKNAWSILGLDDDSLFFLNYEASKGLTDKHEIDSCIKEVNNILKSKAPDTIFVPLYEGGHYQHDVVNYIVSVAVSQEKESHMIYEAPLYNFYFSYNTTPEKILSGLMRLFPFIKYDYRPEFIKNDEIYEVQMTAQQIQQKKDILKKFASQNPAQLISRFGFPDRYQRFHNYNYRLPPFDYSKSVARKLNRLKKIRIVNKHISRIMMWTKTIHPDPDYEITKIPI